MIASYREKAEVTLFEPLSALFTSLVVITASRSLYERDSAVHRGLTEASAIVLVGVTRIAAIDAGQTFAELAKRHAAEPGLLDHLDVVFGGASVAPGIAHSARRAIGGLFGARVDEIVAILAHSAGMKASSAAALLAVVTPVTLGFLSRYLVSQGLDTQDLAGLLRAQQHAWMRVLPPGTTWTS